VVTGAAGLLGALAGCSDESPESSGGSGGESGGGSDDTPTPTPTASGTPTAELRYPELAAQTGLVAENVVWLGAERDEMMTQLRIRTNRVLGAIQSIRNASSVTQNDLTRLEDATTAVAEFVRQNVQPYFPVQNAVTNGNNTFVQQVKLAAERGDSGSLDQALQRAQTFYVNYTKSTYFDDQFPNDVVHARLYDRMTRDDTDKMLFGLFYPATDHVAICHADREPDDISENGVPHHEHTWESGHVVTAHAHPHGDAHEVEDHENEPVDRLVYAYNRETGAFDVLEDDEPDEQGMDEYVVRRSDVFAPIRLTDRHVDEAFLTVSSTETQDDEDLGRNFGDNLPVHLQRFGTAREAEAAVEDLLAANVFQQGVGRIQDDDDDAREWRRVYYTRGEATLYAYMLQVGQVVVTAAPAETEWGNRADWPGALVDCWLGDPSPQDT
jgi:hypothetical protein